MVTSGSEQNTAQKDTQKNISTSFEFLPSDGFRYIPNLNYWHENKTWWKKGSIVNTFD